jgi:shikimate kinase
MSSRGPQPVELRNALHQEASARYVPRVPPVEVLVLHGSPGSGKSTLARAVAEMLREAELTHAVVDLDELNIVYPWPARTFALANLRAIWPNYAAIPDLKLILPTVIVDLAELEQLRQAVPGSRFTVCELQAPEAVLKERVTSREPNVFWQQRLRELVDVFHARHDLEQIRDFAVLTHGSSINASAREVIEKVGWHRSSTATA